MREHGRKDSSLRIGSWNVGSLTGKSAKVETSYKTRNGGSRNGFGVILDERLSKEVIGVYRKKDRLIRVKLICGKEIVNVISAYAPQVGLDAEEKRQFWEDLDDVVQGVHHTKKLYIGGDLNGHVGASRDGYESVHGGFGYEGRRW
ncbi:craniofacial development protein 2-like [Chenopodium quinoa]|uniref:craniofacial development protein 2-like n=1 Tax=Chenopodium quinoa TaxID=63459 RepID=UPI000B77D350|nr:craniofacial development protein 2-like [Chenopodium quinoa]